ncbi:MAG TPA: hypothetical protein VFF73_37405 [Planctomycetota bacterium]|nr:hypothetical protein [Planctomycetota bacterium]
MGPDRGTVLHEDCFGEHGRCVVLGCRGIVRLGPRIEVAPRPRFFLQDPSTTPEAAISLLPRR